MQIPPLPELEEATRKIVKDGKRTGQLSVLTPRIIRSKVEELFALEPGALDAKEYKDALKEIASDEALREDDEPDVTERVEAKHMKKRKSDTQEDLESAKSAKTIKAEQKKLKTVSSVNKNFKSAATIQSSDEEEEDTPEKSGSPLQKACTSRVSDQKHNSSRAMARTKSPSPSQDQTNATNHSCPQVLEQDPSGSAVSQIDEKIDESDSELSVLIDEPPKAKKSSKSKEKNAAKSKSTRDKQDKSIVEPSKHDKTIARLKSMVLACGVRKVWTKEFQNFPKPSQQIKRLKEILTELGMTGRFTLQQAKLIKEKRELAQELADVQSFERLVTSSGTRSQAKPPSSSLDVESADEASTKRKNTARKSIMAFLGDESE